MYIRDCDNGPLKKFDITQEKHYLTSETVSSMPLEDIGEVLAQFKSTHVGLVLATEVLDESDNQARTSVINKAKNK